MPKLKNPFAAAAAFAERLSNPDTPLPLPRLASAPNRKGAVEQPEQQEESAEPAEEWNAVPSPEEEIIRPVTAEAPSVPAAKPALHQPRILREIVIPAAEEAPEEPPVSSFSPESEEPEVPVPPEAEALPQEARQEIPRIRKPRPERSPLSDELRSNLWALSILLGVVCTVVAFFVGALA